MPTRRPVASNRSILPSSSPIGSANGWSSVLRTWIPRQARIARRPLIPRPWGPCASTPPASSPRPPRPAGINGQRPGRVGDSPLIGAGTWADERVAVSCTGQGETFIRAGAARLLAALVERGETLQSAANAAMEAVAQCGGTGGLIAVDAHGNVVTPLSTAAMPRGVWRAGKKPVTTVP